MRRECEIGVEGQYSVVQLYIIIRAGIYRFDRLFIIGEDFCSGMNVIYPISRPPRQWLPGGQRSVTHYDYHKI